MSDVAIFTVGGVLFVLTTWATIAFLLAKVMSLEETNENDGVDALSSD